MTNDTTPKKPRARASGSRKKAGASTKAGARRKKPAPSSEPAAEATFAELVNDMAQQIATGAMQLAERTGGAPFRMARSLLLAPDQRKLFGTDQLKRMHDTGEYLREVRELAGLTLQDLGTAMDMKDESLLKAVESGSATLSVDLILRLASLLARHDPVPFVIRLMRTYNPGAWQVLESWGVGRMPLQLERERRFINIYRSKDEARELDDETFEHVLKFTQSAFDMALHLVSTTKPTPD